jgi:hypothetical protein
MKRQAKRRTVFSLLRKNEKQQRFLLLKLYAFLPKPDKAITRWLRQKSY